MNNRQLTILATAYAVNPYKGSEDGMGWNFALQIARYHKLILVTRENNRIDIERYMLQHPKEVYKNIQILYFDLPYWMRFWKKGGRGAMIYFWLWQRAIPSFVRRSKLAFDVSHNLNFHNDWTPSFLWKLEKPFVWGPIGHHPPIPIQYLRNFGLISIIRDRMKWLVKKLSWNFSISLNATIANAAHIISMNGDVARHISLNSIPTTIIPSVATEDVSKYALVARLKFRVLSAGRLVELKGFDLAIRLFHRFLDTLPAEHREVCEFIIVGKGPLKEKYIELIAKQKLEQNIKIIDWMDRSKLMDLYQQSSVFLFPSHEGAGMVVAEALSHGLPVICLNNSGPGEFIDKTCGVAIEKDHYEKTVTDLANALGKLYNDASFRFNLSRGALKRFQSQFDWNIRGEQLKKIYESVAV